MEGDHSLSTSHLLALLQVALFRLLHDWRIKACIKVPLAWTDYSCHPCRFLIDDPHPWNVDDDGEHIILPMQEGFSSGDQGTVLWTPPKLRILVEGDGEAFWTVGLSRNGSASIQYTPNLR